MTRITHFLAGLAFITLTACKPSTNPGAIEGTITLRGTPPTPHPLDTTMDPNCNPTGAPAPLSEQYVVHGGKLANVYLSIQSAPFTPTQAHLTTVIDQKNCIYSPHIVALQQGGTVVFHNDDEGMHNIETLPTIPGNQRLDTSQGPTAPHAPPPSLTPKP